MQYSVGWHSEYKFKDSSAYSLFFSAPFNYDHNGYINRHYKHFSSSTVKQCPGEPHCLSEE